MLKKLDKYIIKSFLGTYVFMVLLLMGISIVFDVSEKLESFLTNNLTLKEIVFEYYTYFFILYSSMFSSLIVFISAIWFTSQLASRTEIIAILSGGVSFNRMLRPYLIAATILTTYSLVMNHFVVPHANKKRNLFENKYTAYNETYRNRFLEVVPGTILYYEKYKIKTNDVTNIWIEKFEEKEGKKNLIFNLQARRAKGDSISNKWTFTNYFIREVKNNQEIIREGKTLDTVLDFPSIELGQRETIAQAMTTDDLNKFRKKEIEKGSDMVTFLDLERYQRSSLPFATYILTIIAVSVSCRKTRGGVGLNIAIGLAVSMLYIFFQRIMSVSATNAGLDPMIAVWIPNIIFGIVGYFFYLKAPK